ncbi:hypothetical protein KSF78_0009078 [Schistosoma japonicum]|nr:hypothetical protein KSF78_0009078 [Schistosoma japonicum]
MMLLLLLYIYVSLMLIHESTQLIHSKEEISRIKENRLRIQDSLQRSIQSTRTAKQIMQEQEDKMKSHLKNQNRSIDEFTDCAKINIRSIRGNDFTREYYNETIETWSNCLSEMKAKFDEDISKNRMHMCDLLVDPYPPGLRNLENTFVKYYDENLAYSHWFHVHEALSHIIDEHENSGEFRCTLRWPTFHIEITTYYAFYYLHNVNKLNDTYNNRII